MFRKHKEHFQSKQIMMAEVFVYNSLERARNTALKPRDSCGYVRVDVPTGMKIHIEALWVMKPGKRKQTLRRYILHPCLVLDPGLCIAICDNFLLSDTRICT